MEGEGCPPRFQLLEQELARIFGRPAQTPELKGGKERPRP
jgi:hypothetical protein